MQNIFRSNRFLSNAAFGKGNVLGNARGKMVAHHQHVQMFGNRIDGVRPRWVSGGWQDIGQRCHLDDVWRMTTTRTFGVEGVDGTAFEGSNCRFHEATLV